MDDDPRLNNLRAALMAEMALADRLAEALERMRDELSRRFGHADAPFTPWALELLAIVEAAGVDWGASRQ